MCQCGCCGSEGRTKRAFRPLALLFNVVLLYIVLVVGGGTLINTGHPVAVETGRLLQTVTFVDPTIAWADGSGLQGVASGLRLLSAGVPIG
jgi:hypothetical protein